MSNDKHLLELQLQKKLASLSKNRRPPIMQGNMSFELNNRVAELQRKKTLERKRFTESAAIELKEILRRILKKEPRAILSLTPNDFAAIQEKLVQYEERYPINTLSFYSDHLKNLKNHLNQCYEKIIKMNVKVTEEWNDAIQDLIDFATISDNSVQVRKSRDFKWFSPTVDRSLTIKVPIERSKVRNFSQKLDFEEESRPAIQNSIVELMSPAKKVHKNILNLNLMVTPLKRSSNKENVIPRTPLTHKECLETQRTIATLHQRINDLMLQLTTEQLERAKERSESASTITQIQIDNANYIDTATTANLEILEVRMKNEELNRTIRKLEKDIQLLEKKLKKACENFKQNSTTTTTDSIVSPSAATAAFTASAASTTLLHQYQRQITQNALDNQPIFPVSVQAVDSANVLKKEGLNNGSNNSTDTASFVNNASNHIDFKL